MSRHRIVLVLVAALLLCAGAVAMADTRLGTPGSDSLEGTAGPDQLYGEDGDDMLSGLQANDYLEGGPGNDRADGRADDLVIARHGRRSRGRGRAARTWSTRAPARTRCSASRGTT